MQSRKHFFSTAVALLLGALTLLSIPAQAKQIAYTTNATPGSVSVIDTSTNTVTATIGVGGRPVCVAFTPNGSRAYVSNSNSNTVSVINTATNAVIATIALGSFPQGFAVTPNGSRVYVSNTFSNSVSVIDTATNSVIATVAVGLGPNGVAFSPDGALAYVTNTNSSSLSVIDTATNTVIDTIAVGATPIWVAINPDGTRAYVTNNQSNSVSVIDLATDTVVATVPVGVLPNADVVTPDGSHVYLTTNTNNVQVIDTATNTVSATIPVGASAQGIALTSDGTRAYVSVFGSSTVAVIDIATNTVTGSISVGANPVGMAIGQLPATQRYAQINLVSDIPGVAAFTDRKLINPWGIAFGPTSPFWVADNGTGLSTLYAKDGSPISQLPSIKIPPPLGSSAKATPTGMVFNPTTSFVVSSKTNSGPAAFLFATEDGTISGWNPTVALHAAKLAVDNSKIGAVYKGLALAHTPAGDFLYATNFHDGSVEIYDTNFQLVKAFADTTLPRGYAPFGIRAIGGKLYVTFAKQDAAKHDDVPGPGNGFVDVFSLQGHMLKRLVSKGHLNSPWGVALAPANFGQFGGALLVGNFGDGRINGFDPVTGAWLGSLRDLHGNILVIDGLWTITFGNGGSTGRRNELFFSAGPNHEADGLFGVLTLLP